MRGKIVIYLPNGEKVAISGVRETDYDEMLQGKGITTNYQDRVKVNLNNIAVVIFEPEK